MAADQEEPVQPVDSVVLKMSIASHDAPAAESHSHVPPAFHTFQQQKASDVWDRHVVPHMRVEVESNVPKHPAITTSEYAS